MEANHALKIVLGLTCISLSASGMGVWRLEALATTASSTAASERLQAFELDVVWSDATSVKLHWAPLLAATEHTVLRDHAAVGSSIAKVGYFTDFGLRPDEWHEYAVMAYDAAGTLIAQSHPVLAETRHATRVKTHYTVLAIAFNPFGESLVTETIYLAHRVQFLKLASLGSAVIDLFDEGIVSSAAMPRLLPGTDIVDYADLTTRRDLPGLDGYSMVDLIESGEIDHVWVVKWPADASFAENLLVGNRPIQGDGTVTSYSWPPLPVKCSRSFFVNAFSPDERSWDAYVHMVEGIMTSISDGHQSNWPREFPYTVYVDHTNLYERDRGATRSERMGTVQVTDGWNGTSAVAYASAGNANIGSSHFLPTTPRTGGYDDYTYFDFSGPAWHRYVDSAADDWLRYPAFSDKKRKINGYEFGAFNHYKEGDPS